MKAAFIENPGGPEAIQFGDLPDPVPGESEVLIQVEAVAVNPIDTYIRSGKVSMPLPKPFIIGCDLAGIVRSTSSNSKRFKPGDRVWGSNQGLLGRQGTFSELASVEERWLYPIPDSVSFEEAAATALVGITAHLGLVHRAQLKPNENVFVHGGTGGVGSMVVQMAKAIGARVITTAGSEEKARLALQLGADTVIQYKRQNEAEEIRKAAPEGIHLWWETLREPDFDKIVSMLAPGGRVVLMAGREARPSFPVGPFYVKNASLLGLVMFGFPAEEQRQSAEELNGWLASGTVKARIDRVLPLSMAAEAHRLQEENTLGQSGALSGKLVLRPH